MFDATLFVKANSAAVALVTSAVIAFAFEVILAVFAVTVLVIEVKSALLAFKFILFDNEIVSAIFNFFAIALVIGI